MKNRMKALRQDRNLSQAELARSLGISRQAVNGFESGKFDPSLAMAFKIAHLFDAAIEDVFEYEVQNTMQTLIKRITDFLGFDFGFESFSESAIAAISFARNRAVELQALQVEPEHLIAGLLADSTTTSARLLHKHGADLELDIDTNDFKDRHRLKFSRRGKFVLELALQAVRLKEKRSIETEHLLWGVVQLAETDEAISQHLVQSYGVNLRSLKESLQKII